VAGPPVAGAAVSLDPATNAAGANGL
jgi:hypothetical protein